MKKGMSPLIASVLLIAVTVGVAAILINWMTSYTKGQTSKISSQSTTECTYKNIDFTDTPGHNITNGNITLYLENSGSSAVNSTQQYVKIGDSVYPCNASINLAVGEPAVITLTASNCTGLPSSGTLSEVKIVYASPCQSFYSKWTSS